MRVTAKPQAASFSTTCTYYLLKPQLAKDHGKDKPTQTSGWRTMYEMLECLIELMDSRVCNDERVNAAENQVASLMNSQGGF